MYSGQLVGFASLYSNIYGYSLSSVESNGVWSRIYVGCIPQLRAIQVYAPDDKLLDESLRIEIKRTLSSLDKREAQVLSLYFGLDAENTMTLEEIGERFHLTRERVRQIKEKALRRLRHASRSKTLRKYLG